MPSLQLGNNPSSLPSLAKPANSNGVFPNGQYGELLDSKLLPDYYSLLKGGKVFGITGSGNPSAFTGGAAGTPLIGIWNGPNSGVDIVPIALRVAIRTTGAAAVATDFNFWLAQQGSTAITGTQTQARNQYSGVSTGSAAYCMVNTANTGAVASTLLLPSLSIGLTAATAVTNVGQFHDELKGLGIVAPGNYLAWGASVATTTATFDFALLWAEIPV
ncbi:MAG: hypothetical protein KGL39_16760 [Patescibacteria group bacterium]|nr:hypothetical protein [Patescibacteria group bacterium]